MEENIHWKNGNEVIVKIVGVFLCIKSLELLNTATNFYQCLLIFGT